MSHAWNPRQEVSSLRWKEDTLVTNRFGERVWLKPLTNEAGKQIGITECCPEDAPCSKHVGRPQS